MMLRRMLDRNRLPIEHYQIFWIWIFIELWMELILYRRF